MAENPNKVKHLEFVQLAIARMSANSFLLKAWSVTLVAALFALAANDSDSTYVLVAYVPTISFWGLDAYYLQQERLFRELYEEVRVLDEEKITFSMSTRNARSSSDWGLAAFSRTLLAFHGSVVIVVLVVMFVIN